MDDKFYEDFVGDMWGAEPNLPDLAYCAIALPGEVGELCEKIKKYYRGDDGPGPISQERSREILGELGDFLFYTVKMAKTLGFNLSDIKMANMEKLRSRRARGVLRGDGDAR